MKERFILPLPKLIEYARDADKFYAYYASFEMSLAQHALLDWIISGYSPEDVYQYMQTPLVERLIDWFDMIQSADIDNITVWDAVGVMGPYDDPHADSKVLQHFKLKCLMAITAIEQRKGVK